MYAVVLNVCFLYHDYSDINNVQNGMGDKVATFIHFFVTFLAGYVIGFIKGWKLTLIILSLTPLLAVSATILIVVSNVGL